MIKKALLVPIPTAPQAMRAKLAVLGQLQRDHAVAFETAKITGNVFWVVWISDTQQTSKVTLDVVARTLDKSIVFE